MDQPPWEAFPVAASISIFAATLSFPYKYIRCWSSWSGFWGVIWMIGYLLIAGIAGGGIGWLLGWLTNFQPTSIVWLNGFFYGAAGALAIGAQVKGQPKSLKGAGELRDVQSLLLRMLSRIEQSLDELTYQRAKSWLKSQKSSREIALAVGEIKAYIEHEESLKNRRRVLLDSLIVPTLEALAGATEVSKANEYQGQLIEFSARFYVNQHLPKPKLVMPTAIRPRTRKAKVVDPQLDELQPASATGNEIATRSPNPPEVG